MVIGDDEFDAAQATLMEAFEEGTPMDFGLGKGDRDPEDTAAFIGSYTDGREHGGIADDAIIAHFFISGVEDEVADLGEGSGAPGGEFVIEQLAGAADLSGREAFDAEFAHDGLDVEGGDAFDVHFGDGEHDGADRASAAFEGLWVEGFAHVTGGFGDIDGDRPGRGIDPLGLVAIGVTLRA
ncbi:hypothetical protein AruPA_21315 [Acidiphilium sp. PA]|nr:hypothetical protein [Acidiphilium sp. PA]MCW8309552.1 hypothetical protein [Acidiphilium sp. PA]